MNEQKSIEIPTVELEKFSIDISDIDVSSIWLGSRYEIDGDFFQDYDSINYCRNPRLVIFSKVKYPDGYIYYHDLLNDIDSPINNCDMNGRIAKYQIYPKCQLIRHLLQTQTGSLSESVLLEQLSPDIKSQVLGETPYKSIEK